MTDKIQSQMLVMRLQKGMPVKNAYRVGAILKGLYHDYQVHLVNIANYASLCAMEWRRVSPSG